MTADPPGGWLASELFGGGGVPGEPDAVGPTDGDPFGVADASTTALVGADEGAVIPHPAVIKASATGAHFGSRITCMNG